MAETVPISNKLRFISHWALVKMYDAELETDTADQKAGTVHSMRTALNLPKDVAAIASSKSERRGSAERRKNI